MREQQHVGTITKIYEAFGRGDIPFILDQCTEDVHWETHFEPYVPMAGDFSGKRDVPRFFEALDNSLDVIHFSPKEFVAQGDTVVSTGSFGCTVKATRKSAESKWIFIWKFRGDKVSSYEQFHDPALAAAYR